MTTLIRRLAMFAMALFLVVGATACDQTGARHPSVTAGGDSSVSTTTSAQTKTQQQLSAEAFYRQVWELARDNFLWDNRLQQWQSWEHKFDGQLYSQADAERAVNQMLGSLNDPYTYFKNASVTTSRGNQAQAKGVVTYRMLPDSIGYIRIRTFGSVHTSGELEAALKAMPNAKAYIIDLRDNGGGYVWQAFRSFALVTDQGVFTEMRGRSGGKAYVEKLEVTATQLVDDENGTVSRSARPANLAGTKPIIVLVNGDSASASEMFSGALRDNGRATIVGTLTFGKGIAQNTWDLPGKTSVQITFAQYYLPGGTTIHGTGITPDNVVAPTLVGDGQLQEAVRVAKDKLKP